MTIVAGRRVSLEVWRVVMIFLLTLSKFVMLASFPVEDVCDELCVSRPKVGDCYRYGMMFNLPS